MNSEDGTREVWQDLSHALALRSVFYYLIVPDLVHLLNQ